MQNVKNISTTSTTSAAARGQVFRLGRSGLMEELQPVPALPVGTRVIGYGYAGAVQYFAVIDSARNLVEIPHEYAADDDAVNIDEYFGPFQTLDEYAQPIANRFGIGLYYDLNAPRYDADEIARAIAYGERVERLKEERAAAAARARAELSARYAREYSYLTRNPKTSRELTDNLRTELKRNFPGVKFSVRYTSFSGGDKITVKWQDGPKSEQVQAIAGKYQHSHADDSGDYWDYDPNEFNKLFGGAKYVMVTREMSESVAAALTAEVLEALPFLADGAEIHYEKFFELLHDAPCSADERMKYAEAVRGGYWVNARALARWIHQGIDYTQPEQQSEPQTATNDERADEPTTTANGLQVVDYSERAIAITGDTRDVKTVLKSLGGRFNPRLSCGAGWVFPKVRKNEVLHALGL